MGNGSDRDAAWSDGLNEDDIAVMNADHADDPGALTPGGTREQFLPASGGDAGTSSPRSRSAASDPRCPNCDIPLRAVVTVIDGRCADAEACNARRSLGPGHLLNPDVVTPFGAKS